MNWTHYLRKTILFFFAGLTTFGVYAQPLLESRQSSAFTYIFKINDQEAKKIYTKKKWQVDPSFFHTLVDSFPTYTEYTGKLPNGHYLKTFAEKDKQKLSITTVQDFEVFIFNNNTDLCIQIYDLKGNLIDNASVKIRGKKLRFNKKTQSYLHKKSNQKGLLKVTYNGFTAYSNLSRAYNNSFFKRGLRKVIYGKPIRYVWMPVQFVVLLPIDGVNSIVRGWPQGRIWMIKDFFVKAYEKVACLFDDYYCDTNYKFENKHTGYLVFNKPKYLPGDTVKFKAFLTTTKGKPVKKTIKVVLQNRGKDIELTTLKPYRKGAYAYEFYLHDSLNLKLDNNYGISLRLKTYKEYINAYFKYEDYELKKNKIAIRLDEKVHYRGKTTNLFVKGTDENDLNLLDARLEVLLSHQNTFKYFDKNVFIPDTLLFLKQRLDPTDETKIVLSDSIFPKANFEYHISVRLLTSDNEAITESQKMIYLYESKKIDIKLIQDSIHFDYLKDGQSEAKEIIVKSIDNFGNETEAYKGLVPCNIEINPYYSTYKVDTDSTSSYINLSQENSLLKIYSERTKDSVYIIADNPRKIPFQYNIYKRNKQKSLGYTDSLKYLQQTNSKQNYFLSIRYLWGGKVKEENYEIPYVDKKLNISVTQPKIVYPGQKTKIDVLVTDAEGVPVEGVDLTAYSYTSKFYHPAPEVPYLGKKRKNKVLINNFKFDRIAKNKQPDLPLDFDQWRKPANLESIEYYKFNYPKNSIYRSTYYPKDSITQFAPFVFSDGKPTPVHVIYVDNKPIYFSWSTNTQAYSFKIDSGFHQIKIRTSFREIIIDSLYFEPNKKTIFSVDQDSKNRQTKTKKVEDRLSDAEKAYLYKYILPYENNFKGQYAFIEQGKDIHFLQSPNSYNSNNFAGPLAGKMTFHLLDSFSTTFQHEPFHEYLFKQGLLKMRTIERRKYPDYLRYQTNQGLKDEVQTLTGLEKQWNEYVDSKRYLSVRYINPNSTITEEGRLHFNMQTFNTSVKEKPLNILIFKNNDPDFLRIYPGSSSTIHGLEKGYYKLIFLYPDKKYQVEDSLNIKVNGLNYFAFDKPLILQKDSFSIKVNQIIEENLFKPKAFEFDAKQEMNRIQNQHREKFKFSGVGKIIDGYIVDADGETLIGASVLIKGTSYGAVTDIDGYYSITVPPGYNTLVVSYTGYSTTEHEIGYSNNLSITLDESATMLNEVVVVGYGVQKKSSVAGSVTTLTTGNLMGEIPGVNGQALTGKAAGIIITPSSGNNQGVTNIMVRGMSNTFENTPLYIIDGKVFTGDINELSSEDIENIEILKDASAVTIYGSRGVNGVVIISTKPGSFKSTQQISKATEHEDLFYESASQSNSIRDNFSDYAFWQPSLITNKDGIASFEAVFPDDITSWKTQYLAMNGKRQSGQTSGIIKSYKPLMAQLALPRFLVQGDTTYAIGKALNYLPDSTEVETKFEINGSTISNDIRYCSTALIDTATIVASIDSLAIKYYLEAADDYMDGEKRIIPVFQRGLEKTKGAFYNLEKDTAYSLQFDANLGEVTLYARADILHVVDDEIQNLINYKYACNEQLASKLKALVAAKSIAKYRNEKFKHDKKVEKIIRQLKKNQNEIGLWGWWKKSKENLWISLHVLEALFQAEEKGYNIALNKNQITDLLIWEIESSEDFNNNLRMLKILMLTDRKANYKTQVAKLEKVMGTSLNDLLHIIDLKQQVDLSYDLDTLEHFKKTSILGNTYYSDKNQTTNLLNNNLQNTLLAYKVLKADSTTTESMLGNITNYILENRRNGYWRNTFESAQVIETILQDVLNKKTILAKPSLLLRGDIDRVVNKFPFELKVDPNKTIEIIKSGDYPVYFTSYQKYWDTRPASKTGDFDVSTNFENALTNALIAGKETKLITKVTVKKDAEYVMINIPIPGGCSYASKDNNFRNEVHREYFKNETTIFCRNLPAGEYSFEVDLIPRYSGTYTVNPAKVELMYFPTFNANNEIKLVNIHN